MGIDVLLKKVVVLGGGTAGWMTATYLAKAFPETISVTVLEAPAIPKIGVGEATVPNLQRVFFDFLGLSEKEWMRHCNGSFKMGIKYINWHTGGAGDAKPRPRADGPNGRDYFYHIFGLLPSHERFPLSHHWVADRLAGRTTEPFEYACYREPPLMDANLSPCRRDGTPWTSYAWHFDAQSVADFLQRLGVNDLGVRRIQDELSEPVLDQRGFITALRTKGGLTIEGDLFIDCSGFRGLLINKAMREPFLDMSDHLLNDRAVAMQVPNDDVTHGVEPYTSAIAMSAGWTWKIPMLGRFGTGYVYSSRFINQDKAAYEFCRMWDVNPNTQPLNHIQFRVGRNRRTWVKNCVSIGLSSCFLEPLESTGIYFICAAIYQLVKHFPDKRFDPILIDSFNREIEIMFDDSRDFIQGHFSFAPRNDTPYWRACKELRLADDFQLKVNRYRAGMQINPPFVDEASYYTNFDAEFHNFWQNSNYYCIFAGLGVVPDKVLPELAHRPGASHNAAAAFESIRQRRRELEAEVPTTHAYLRQFHSV
jgi:tryptophan halogenase